MNGIIKVGVVDCDINDDLCEDNEIEGYPTVKFFAGKIIREYSGIKIATKIIDAAMEFKSMFIDDKLEDEMLKTRTVDLKTFLLTLAVATVLFVIYLTLIVCFMHRIALEPTK